MIPNKLLRRRSINSLLLLSACAVATFIFRLTEISLINSSEWTGWLLFSAISFLFLYAVRKRLSTLDVGRVAIWLQAHIYVGFFSVFIFLLHINWKIPTGWLGIFLTICFLGTVATGMVGLAWSRFFPRLITRLGDEVLYDRIKPFCMTLRDQVEQKISEAINQTGSLVLTDFYQNTGYHYFANPKFQWPRLFKDYQPIRNIEHELKVMRRYMNEDETQFVDDMIELVRKKDVLDGHYTYQSALKYWLIVHLSFSLALIPIVALHIVLVYSFTSI